MSDAQRIESLERAATSLVDATEALWRVLDGVIRGAQIRAAIGGGAVQVLLSVPRLVSDARSALRPPTGA